MIRVGKFSFNDDDVGTLTNTTPDLPTFSVYSLKMIAAYLAYNWQTKSKFRTSIRVEYCFRRRITYKLVNKKLADNSVFGFMTRTSNKYMAAVLLALLKLNPSELYVAPGT